MTFRSFWDFWKVFRPKFIFDILSFISFIHLIRLWFAVVLKSGFVYHISSNFIYHLNYFKYLILVRVEWVEIIIYIITLYYYLWCDVGLLKPTTTSRQSRRYSSLRKLLASLIRFNQVKTVKLIRYHSHHQSCIHLPVDSDGLRQSMMPNARPSSQSIASRFRCRFWDGHSRGIIICIHSLGLYRNQSLLMHVKWNCPLSV
jgi:signal transduction histidine kinase